jgi:hypothetical protein
MPSTSMSIGGRGMCFLSARRDAERDTYGNRLLISFYAGRRGYEEDHVGVNFLVSDERRCVGAIQSEQGKLAGTKVYGL